MQILPGISSLSLSLLSLATAMLRYNHPSFALL